MRRKAALTNSQISALLSREAEAATGHIVQAFRRAARNALRWPEEAADLIQSGRPLTELPSVGPYLAKVIAEWIATPPQIEVTKTGKEKKTRDPEEEFLTRAQAVSVLAAHPLWQARLKGDLQMHTTWSDGSGSILDMARAGAQRGYSYIGITDHTQGLKIANGLDERRLARQAKEIAEVNKLLKQEGTPLTVLRSAEVNLSPLGEVDMKPAALATLDIVLGAFHSSLRRKEDQTERYLAAIRNPNIQVLGHPQCRIINYRPGLQADWPRVFAEAAKLDKAVEIDGYADRQDLKLSLLKLAKKEGVRISLGTDAHHPWQLEFIEFSLALALLAKIPKERILNFMPPAELKAWAQSVRAAAVRKQRS
jgi:histidinol phosphatase-like PHP family hydrolase